MKRLLTLIAASLMFAGIANAQISIKKSDYERSQRMTTLALEWSWIYKNVDNYYLVMKSSNQFDNDYWLLLGDTQEECLSSIESLIELSQSITDTDYYDIQNGEGEEYRVTQYISLGIKGLTFNGDGFAGYGYILPSNLKKAQKWIKSNVK